MSFSITFPVPAIRGHFGHESLVTFQTQIRPDLLTQLLGHDPRPENWPKLPANIKEIYENVQRKTEKARRDGVLVYLEDRLLSRHGPGAFPAICIGMTNAPTFKEGTDKHADLGELMLDISHDNERIVLDGLGRLAGTLAFLEKDKQMRDLLTLPTTFFAPHEKHGKLSLEELGQLFFDFNFRAQPISRAHALRLDHSDLYLVLTNHLGSREVIAKHGRMEVGQQSLGSKSTALVTQAVLLRFVRGACEGAKFQKSNKATLLKPNLTRDTMPRIQDELEQFLGWMAHEMGHATFKSRESLHFTSVGWQALGLAAYDLYVTLRDVATGERERAVRQIAKLDWRRSDDNEEMIKIGVLSRVGKKVGLSGRGAAAVGALHDFILHNTDLGKLVRREPVAA